jgi:long-chain-fatty-acid--CoA ligase ACSBG
MGFNCPEWAIGFTGS